MEIKIRNNRGITLIALVVTIVVLLILAGVSLAMLRGENGIISKAQKSARETRLAKTKESISLEISDAMINEAIKGNKTLTDEQLKDIVNKYGEMDEDGDTIHTDDGDLSLKDLINGTTSGGGTGGSSGSTEELAQEVEKLKTTIDTLNKQISKLEKEKEALNAKIAELQGRINELESQLSEANKSKAELEETINNLRDENTRLNNKITDLMAQLEEKNQQTTENDGTIENLKNQITELETRIQELETELANKENELANKDERIASLEEQVRDLQQQIEDSNNEISNKDAIIDSLNSTIESLTNQIESLNEQIEQLENQIEQKDAEIADLKSKQATGNATVDQVLSGSTFSNSSGIGLTGTMPAYTSGSTAVTTSGKWGFDTTYGPWLYVPNSGYYATGHWLNIPWNTIKGSLGDAGTGNVLTGKTFTSTNGVKITGTMPNRGALNWTPSNGTTYTVPAGYYSGGTLNSTTAYNNGYNSGVSAADNRANPSSTNYKTGYNAGVSAGNSAGAPSTSYIQAFWRDDESAHTWTCGTTGYYMIFVYGFVNAKGRYENPSLTINGTKVSEHIASNTTENKQYLYLYKINAGSTVSCSWSVHRGTYYWRNLFAIFRCK